MPLVSIVTPVYNAGRWLPETLASVRAQTFASWEHLLVDDGSKDDSVAIIEAAAGADARFRLIRMGSNGGPSAARNRAIDAARGRFIAFLDADDLWLPSKLAHSIEYIQSHGYDFVYHDYRHLSHDGALIGRLVHGPDELNLRTLHTHRGHGGCLSMVVNRERIPELRFPNMASHDAEDFCLWVSLIQKGYVGHRLTLDLGRYRLTPQSRSANKVTSALNVWHLYRTHSQLSFWRAANWWSQYAWSSFWLYLRARPAVRPRAPIYRLLLRTIVRGQAPGASSSIDLSTK